MNAIKFAKMHGLGNDFVIINAIDQSVSLTPEVIRRMADRHRGIGFDQLLLVEKATSQNVDFGYRIFNADGSEAEQCGNGARCFAQFVRREQLSDKRALCVQTIRTTMTMNVLDEIMVSVSMGMPTFRPIEVAGIDVPHTALSIGNPHLVLDVPDLEQVDIERIGAGLQQNESFPGGVNVGFMQRLSPERIRLRVYERGAGETQACGSGACAAVVSGIHADQLNRTVDVELLGGRCKVSWMADTDEVWLTGPTAWVFDGVYEIK